MRRSAYTMEMTVKDAAKMFNASVSTIYKWVEDLGMPAVRVQEQVRFNKTELLEWATVSGVRVSVESLSDTTETNGALPEVSDAIRAGGVFFGVPGRDRDSVMKSVVRLIRLPKTIDRKFLLQMLRAREALGSTGVGGGIAIPHPRTPIILRVDEPAIGLLFLEHPVDFGSIDGKPVDTLFTLVSPTVKTHLHLLSRLAFLLHEPGLKKVLKQRLDEKKILDTMERIEIALKNKTTAGSGGLR
jgi:PTS system nitrogen regulatory IIA component